MLDYKPMKKEAIAFWYRAAAVVSTVTLFRSWDQLQDFYPGIANLTAVFMSYCFTVATILGFFALGNFFAKDGKFTVHKLYSAGNRAYIFANLFVAKFFFCFCLLVLLSRSKSANGAYFYLHAFAPFWGVPLIALIQTREPKRIARYLVPIVLLFAYFSLRLILALL